LTDPTGIYFQYKATAIGEAENEIKDILNKEYKDTMDLEEGSKLAIRALKKVLGKDFDIKRVDGAYIKMDEKKFKRIDTKYLTKLMK
ncbi:MAG: proteasome subunit alpha, partial [Nanoarchaeota archaeon]